MQAQFAAQGKLLDVANNKVFELETTIKTDAHKVQRLRDYEKRIEQLTEMHRMWFVWDSVSHKFLIAYKTSFPFYIRQEQRHRPLQ